MPAEAARVGIIAQPPAAMARRPLTSPVKIELLAEAPSTSTDALIGKHSASNRQIRPHLGYPISTPGWNDDRSSAASLTNTRRQSSRTDFTNPQAGFGDRAGPFLVGPG